VAGDTSTAQKVLSKLISVNETYIQTRDEEAYKSSVENVYIKLEESINALNKTQDLLKDIEQNQLVKNIKKLTDLIEDKKNKINEKGKRVLNARMRIERMDSEAKGAAEMELLKREEAFDQEIKDIDSNIESIVNTQIL